MLTSRTARLCYTHTLNLSASLGQQRWSARWIKTKTHLGFIRHQSSSQPSKEYLRWKAINKALAPRYLDSTAALDLQPYLKKGPWWNPFSVTGRKALWTQISNHALYFLHSMLLRRDMNYNRKEFIENATKQYINMYSAFARRDLPALRPLVTHAFLRKIAPQMKSDELKLSWEFKKMIQRPKLVALIYIRESEETVPFSVAQIYLKFKTIQAIQISNAKNEVLNTKEFEKEETVVFERVINKYVTPWRVMDIYNSEGQAFVTRK